MVWHFSTCELIRKMRMIIVLDDYESDCGFGVLANEVLKTVSNLNPNYMKDIFTPKLHPKVRPNDILLKHHNTYGAKKKKH